MSTKFASEKILLHVLCPLQARHVPLPLKAKVEKELARMVELGVITKVDEPTNWCSGMVVVPKKMGK